jgi:hypothetical protein
MHYHTPRAFYPLFFQPFVAQNALRHADKTQHMEGYDGASFPLNATTSSSALSSFIVSLLPLHLHKHKDEFIAMLCIFAFFSVLAAVTQVTLVFQNISVLI